MVVTYREWVVNEMTSPLVGAGIVERTPLAERKDTQFYFLSPDAFGERDSENTIADEIAAQLRPFNLPVPLPADNDRKGGYLLMHALLYNTKMRGQADPLSEIMVRGKAATDTVWLISAECPELLNSIPLLMRDPKTIDDVPENGPQPSQTRTGLRRLLPVFSEILAQSAPSCAVNSTGKGILGLDPGDYGRPAPGKSDGNAQVGTRA